MDVKDQNKAVSQAYHEAEEWHKNVKHTDGEAMAYLSAIAMMIEVYDPANAYPLYTAVNKLFFSERS